MLYLKLGFVTFTKRQFETRKIRRKVYDFYRSWEGYDDELGWAAIWLYGTTQDKKYLTRARELYKASGRTNRKNFTWDNKWPGVKILLARLGEDDMGMVSESQHYIRNLMKFSKYTKKVSFS